MAYPWPNATNISGRQCGASTPGSATVGRKGTGLRTAANPRSRRRGRPARAWAAGRVRAGNGRRNVRHAARQSQSTTEGRDAAQVPGGERWGHTTDRTRRGGGAGRAGPRERTRLDAEQPLQVTHPDATRARQRALAIRAG
eukprot:4701744-Prymnesium_polylepis.1